MSWWSECSIEDPRNDLKMGKPGLEHCRVRIPRCTVQYSKLLPVPKHLPPHQERGRLRSMPGDLRSTETGPTFTRWPLGARPCSVTKHLEIRAWKPQMQKSLATVAPSEGRRCRSPGSRCKRLCPALWAWAAHIELRDGLTSPTL